jgi:hypothetical protein
MLRCTLPSGPTEHWAIGPFNPWLLLHLETLFAQSSLILPEECDRLGSPDTPEEVYIAKARLALYDSLEAAEHKETKLLKPDPQLLRVFLRSKNYGVCTGAFQLYLNLVAVGQPSAVRDPNSTSMFIPERMEHEWIEHIIRVLCWGDKYDKAKSWILLAKHLVPKWTMFPSSCCISFASVILFSNGHPPGMHELPVYQCFAEAFNELPRNWHTDEQQDFLLFLATMLELIKSSLTWGKLTSIEDWLAQLPQLLENQDVHMQIKSILATRKKRLIQETLRFLAELPMADSELEE